MSDKPTSAGLWTREGKLYRVWHDGETAKMIGQHIDGDTGFTGGLIWNLPTGNWRKITAGTAPATPEVIERTSDDDSCRTCDEGFEGVHCPSCGSLKRELDAAVHHHAYNMGKIDLALGEPRYDHCSLLEGFLRKIAELRTPPEVIEGRGQVVTAEQAGQYWGKDGNAKAFYCTKCEGGEFMKGTRYMRISEPTFPPRAAFVAPPKPEQVLDRCRIFITEQFESGRMSDTALVEANFLLQDVARVLNLDCMGNPLKPTGEPLATN
jgi:hypothetical protein